MIEDNIYIQNDTSVLYNLSPVNIGTMEVESLTSYIARLSEEHCVNVSTLINEILIKEIEKEGLYRRRNLSAIYKTSTSKFNGLTTAAEKHSNILNKLTGRNDLQYLTLLPYKEIISNFELLKENKYWCPICLEEMKESKVEVYDKLIWSFQLVNVCHIHHIRLENTCPKCGTIQKPLQYKMINGYCQKCKDWLGKKVLEKVPIETDLDIVYLIGDLLKSTANYFSFKKELVQKSVERIYKYIPSPKREYIYGNIGINGKTITDYVRGANKLSLFSFVKICSYYQVSIIDLLNNNLNFPLEIKNRRKINELRQYKKINMEELEYELKVHLELFKKREVPINIRFFVKQIGVVTARIKCTVFA